MNKTEKKTIKEYIKQTTGALTGCSWSLKLIIANKLKLQIKECFESKEITYDSLCAELGTPEEIAAGFYDREEYGKLLKKSKLLNIVLVVLAVMLIAAVIILVVVIVHLYSMVGGEFVISPPIEGTYPIK